MSVIRAELPPDATASVRPGESYKAPEEKTPTPNQTPQAERPAWLPEKFKSPEDLAKAYSELEKKQGGAKPPAEKPGEAPKSGEQPPKAGEKPAEGEPKTGEEADFAPFYEEFAREGKLSEDSYKKLAEQHKLPKAVVDSFIADRIARQEAESTKAAEAVFAEVGGADNYKALAEWARGNLSPEEQAAYNKVVDSGDVAAIKLAVAGLNQKFTAAEGRPAARLRGTAASSHVTPFKNTSEVTAAMNDPRYATEAEYRQEVAQRLMASTVF